MELISTMCNGCGAPLEIAAETRFVTCHHCGGRLTVRRTENAIFTEQLDRLEEKTDRLAARVEQIAAGTELEQLEREWERDRESFLVTDKRGHRHIPAKGSVVAGGIAVSVFGVFWTIMATAMTGAAPNVGPFAVAKVIFPLFGVAFVAFGIFTTVAAYRKAEAFERAERRYRQKRRELQGKS